MVHILCHEDIAPEKTIKNIYFQCIDPFESTVSPSLHIAINPQLVICPFVIGQITNLSKAAILSITLAPAGALLPRYEEDAGHAGMTEQTLHYEVPGK